MQSKADLHYRDFVVVTFFILATLAGLYLALRFNATHGLFTHTQISSRAAASIVLPTLAAYDAPFDETGVLIWYPNNVGPVPWIFYADTHGNIGSKALVFDTPVALPHATSTIRVVGLAEDEHVRVRSVSILQSF